MLQLLLDLKIIIQTLKSYSSKKEVIGKLVTDLLSNSAKKLKKILNSDSFSKINTTTIKRIKRNYFYRLDNKAYLRFWNFVKRQNI